MRKNIYFLIIMNLMLLNIKYSSQTPSWIWAQKEFSSSGIIKGVVCSSDNSGNLYLAGSYSVSVVFGTTNLNTTNGSACFLVKCDNAGIPIWAKSMDFVNASDIECDNTGNIYLSGTTYPTTVTINFGNGVTLNTSGISKSFLCKFDNNGNALWVKTEVQTTNGSAAGPFGIYEPKITTTFNGNVIFTARYSYATIKFGSITLFNSHGGNSNTFDVCIVKYDANGNLIWAKSGGGSNALEDPKDIVTDNNENVYLVGNFNSGNSQFGSNILVGSSLSSASYLFVVKMDNLGNFIWAITQDAGSTVYGKGIKVDASGSVFVCGDFASTTSFGTYTITPIGMRDGFLLKLDNNANIINFKNFGGTNDDYCDFIVMDNVGNLYIYGTYLSSTVTFLNSNITKSCGSSSTCNSLYVAKFNNNVTNLWSITLSPSTITNTIYVSGMSISPQNEVFISGYSISGSQLVFGSTTVNGRMFYAKLFDNTTNIDIDNNDKIDEVVLYPNPTKNKIFLHSEPFKNTLSKVELIDITGKKILSFNYKKLNDNTYELENSMLYLVPEGVYFCKIHFQENVLVKKIIITK